ncbi:hypothetical protein ACQ4LE_004876 [Meloidogyne hapla]
MFGSGIFTRSYSISSEENIQEENSEDDIGLSFDYSNKEENNKKNLKNFIRSQHMNNSIIRSSDGGGGFLDLLSRGQKQKDSKINLNKNVLTNGSWSEQEDEIFDNSQNEDFGDNGLTNNLQNNYKLLNGNNKKINKNKNFLSSVASSSLSSFTFTTDSHINKFIEGRKINDFINSSCNSSLIELNENSNITKFVERRNWDEEDDESLTNLEIINSNNLLKNGNSINTINNLKSQLSSSSLNGHSTLNSSLLNIPQLNSADSCSTLQEIPKDCLQKINDPFLLYNEKNNLFNLASKLGVKFEIREAEGAFVFSQPLTKRIIIFNPQLYNGQKIEGIRISLHKNERLYRESHLWPVEKWLGLATIEGVCTRFFSSSCDI